MDENVSGGSMGRAEVIWFKGVKKTASQEDFGRRLDKLILKESLDYLKPKV
ncbi:hypothetical protein [Planktomarina sp.]|uniref:hypothetical protein n=1 Tax=Planktomarina sp. TaxID=2024851 RepID=UPI00325FE295